MKGFSTVFAVFLLLQSCQLLFNSGVDSQYSKESFSRLARLKGEYEIYSEVQIAFELFEESKAEAEIEADEEGQALTEYFEGYFKDDKWRMQTRYKLMAEDSIEVIISDSRDTVDQVFRGSFVEGFLAVETPDGMKKMEIRLLDERLIKKVYRSASYDDADWQLIQYMEYVRD